MARRDTEWTEDDGAEPAEVLRKSFRRERHLVPDEERPAGGRKRRRASKERDQ
jgi:hypothetical protein